MISDEDDEDDGDSIEEEEEDEEEDEDEEKEVLRGIARVMQLAIIGQMEYLVKGAQNQIVGYQDVQMFKEIDQKHLRSLYKPFAFGVNALLTRSHSYQLQYSLLKLLKRFYDCFDKENRRIFEGTIITIL